MASHLKSTLGRSPNSCRGLNRIYRAIAASITRMVTFVRASNFLMEQRMNYTCNCNPEPPFSEKDCADPVRADYVAQTSYWTLIEASLAIVSACLPTLRPLFHGFSPESVVRSFRSAMSLGSVGMTHSVGSKQSHASSSGNCKESSSSMVPLDWMSAADHGSSVEVTGVADGPKVGRKDIMVQKSFEVAGNTV